MTDSKIYNVLTYFDKVEQNRLRKYVRSPYFNVNETLMSFYDILSDHINGNGKAGQLSKEQVWMQLYGKEAFNDVRFRKLSSDLLKLVEGFLCQEKFDNDNLQKVSYLLEAVGEKKVDKLYNSTTKSSRDLLKNQNLKPSGFYYHQYLIERNYYKLSEIELKRSEKSNAEDIINNLDRFFLAEKLKWYCGILSRKSLISHEYQLLFIDEIIAHLEKYQYHDIPPIQIYYQIYLIQTKPNEESHYYDLKKLINQYWRQFDMVEAEEIYFYLINYCIKKLNQGNQFYLREFIEVYKEILQKNILPNNELNPWNFKNAIQIALRLGEYEWVEKFISDYSMKLPAEFRENAVSYNLAQVYFYKKEYNKVISTLQSVEYEDIAYNLGSKSMLLAIYYELDADEALMSLMDSFKTYLNRHKDIAENKRTHFYNLMKYIKKMLKIIPGDIREIEQIKKEMEEDRKIGIASEKWILEKLTELE